MGRQSLVHSPHSLLCPLSLSPEVLQLAVRFASAVDHVWVHHIVGSQINLQLLQEGRISAGRRGLQVGPHPRQLPKDPRGTAELLLRFVLPDCADLHVHVSHLPLQQPANQPVRHRLDCNLAAPLLRIGDRRRATVVVPNSKIQTFKVA